MDPAKQPTATGVALCHKKVGDPFCLRGDYLFSQISLFHMKSNLPMCLFLNNFINKTNNITTLTM
jgi:hypothetical protein